MQLFNIYFITQHNKTTQYLFKYSSNNPQPREHKDKHFMWYNLQTKTNFINIQRRTTQMVTPNEKKTIRIKRSNIELLNNLQKAVEIEERKKVTMTDIINVAIAELFQKKDYMNDIDFVGIVKVLKCYNIL